MKYRIYPYMKGSKSAKAVSDAIGSTCKVLRSEGSTWRSKPVDVVINWGSKNLDRLSRYPNVKNRFVEQVSNKLSFFESLQESPYLVNFWRDTDSIPQEILDTRTIVARTILSGHSGQGIVLHPPGTPREALVAAPLYTLYEKKTHEYRIHIGLHLEDGEAGIFLLQKKVRTLSNLNPNWQIRSHQNGFIYSKAISQEVPIEVARAAFDVFNRTTLDFGALDIIYHEPTNKAYCLEINTAPGLEGSSTQAYADFFTGNFTE
jgi:hypothetical protein